MICMENAFLKQTCLVSNNASRFSQCNQAHFAYLCLSESLPPSNWPLAGGGGGTRGLQLLSLLHQWQLHAVAHFISLSQWFLPVLTLSQAALDET